MTARLATTLVAVATGVVASQTGLAPASAATVQDCTTWGTTSVGGGAYIYQQNEWNSDTRQCVSVDNSTGAFTLDSVNMNASTSGAPGTYPSIYKGCHWGVCTTNSGMPIRVSDIGTATTSWSTTQPGSGAYDVAYDLWFNSTPTTTGQPDGTEVMIWLNSRGGVQPFGSKTTTATVAGKQWDVWIGQQAGWKIISYVLQPGATSVSNLDTKAMIDDAVNRGQINPAHYLLDAEAGFEVWTGGTGLASNSFSFTVSPKGATTTPPASPTPTVTTPTPTVTTAAPTTPNTSPRPPSTSTTPPDPSTGGCTAALTVSNSWSGGFVATVRVTAGITSIRQWKVGLTVPAGSAVTNLWNGQLSGSSVSNAPYNGALSPNGTAEFGFQGTGSASGLQAASCSAG